MYWNSCLAQLEIKEAKMGTKTTEVESLNIAGTYHNIGMILEKQENWDGSLQKYEIARKIRNLHESRDEIQSHKAIASVLEKKGFTKEAEEHRRIAIKIGQESPMEPFIVSEL